MNCNILIFRAILICSLYMGCNGTRANDQLKKLSSFRLTGTIASMSLC